MATTTDKRELHLAFPCQHDTFTLTYSGDRAEGTHTKTCPTCRMKYRIRRTTRDDGTAMVEFVETFASGPLADVPTPAPAGDPEPDDLSGGATPEGQDPRPAPEA